MLCVNGMGLKTADFQNMCTLYALIFNKLQMLIGQVTVTHVTCWYPSYLLTDARSLYDTLYLLWTAMTKIRMEKRVVLWLGNLGTIQIAYKLQKFIW